MTLTTLTIQTEAWVQEEIGAQGQMLTVLAGIERAARGGESAELARGGRELEGLLALAATRDARRRALLSRLAAALGLAPNGVNLSRLVQRLESEQQETRRLQSLRAELRGVVAAVVKSGRRLSALAHYHRGLLDEICGLLLAGSSAATSDGTLIDAQG